MSTSILWDKGLWETEKSAGRGLETQLQIESRVGAALGVPCRGFGDSLLFSVSGLRIFTRIWSKETGESADGCIQFQQLLLVLAGDTAWGNREQSSTVFGSSSQALHKRESKKGGLKQTWTFSKRHISGGPNGQETAIADVGKRARFPTTSWRGFAERSASLVEGDVFLLNKPSVHELSGHLWNM